MKKEIKFYLNSQVIISSTLILFSTVMPGFVSTCYAQDSPWTQKADMLVPRGMHSSCVLDGKIYAIGGVTSASAPATKTVQIYDPVQNNWTYKADMVAGRASFATCVDNGKIWAIGGASVLWYSSIKSIEEYNPATDTWTHKTDMPGARQGHTTSLVDGKIYIIGGGETYENAIAEVDVYDTLKETWTKVSEMPTPRIYLTAVVLNGKIYAIGGHKGVQDNEMPTTTVEVYDPATDTWTQKANMNTPRNYGYACVLNNKIYVFGGKGGAHNDCASWPWHVEVYDPEADSWTEVATTPTRVMVANSVAPSNGKVYVSGGEMHDNSEVCIAINISKMYTYNPDHDLYPLIEKTEVDKGYAKAGIDSVCITAKISDPTGITLLAEIAAPDQTPVDSLQLFDDGNHNDEGAGDSLYANVWPVSSSEERQYFVDLQVTRVDADTVIHHINDMASFTTIGTVTIEDYTFTGSDTEPNPGDRLKLNLTLKNNSSVATATNLEAKLVSLDILVSVPDNFYALGDLGAGEDSTFEKTYIINISEECPVNTQIPILVYIKSNGYTFWSDTFPITVQEPSVNIKDFREPVTNIYPNPTENILNIEISNKGNQELEIEILTVTGKVIYQKEYRNINAHLTEQIDLSGYAKGIYLIKVRQANSVYVGKVVMR